MFMGFFFLLGLGNFGAFYVDRSFFYLELLFRDIPFHPFSLFNCFPTSVCIIASRYFTTL